MGHHLAIRKDGAFERSRVEGKVKVLPLGLRTELKEEEEGEGEKQENRKKEKRHIMKCFTT